VLKRERERREKLPTNFLCFVIEPEEKFILPKLTKKVSLGSLILNHEIRKASFPQDKRTFQISY
jgi:predicted ATP-grasp superfamily ATP-dependent carboligase